MPQVDYSRDQIFFRLPEALCQLLYDAGEIARVPSGTVIVNEGEKLDRLSILLFGETTDGSPTSD
jgi:hypothetical protein